MVRTFPIEDNHVSIFPNTPHSKGKNRFPRKITSITIATSFPIKNHPILEIACLEDLVGYAHSQLNPNGFDPNTVFNGMNNRFRLPLTCRA